MSDAAIVAVVESDGPKAILSKRRLDDEFEQRRLLAEFIRAQMVDGTDFGRIPGTERPTLLKPGAEKLTDLFRCTPRYKLIKVEEDFDKGFFNYIFRVQLFQREAQAVVAEGYGSCNSREARYRWRDAQRKCPGCDKAAIFRSKAEYGGGWYCSPKKGGCNAKYSADDKVITSQVAGRVENDDIASSANTILKMGKKRALVDAALALGRCSDMFTQDMEDEGQVERPPESKKPEGAAQPKPGQTRTQALREKLQKSPITDVRPGETEEQAKARAAVGVAIYGRLEKQAQLLGVNAFALADIIKRVTGRGTRGELEETDFEKVRAALVAASEKSAPV